MALTSDSMHTIRGKDAPAYHLQERQRALNVYKTTFSTQGAPCWRVSPFEMHDLVESNKFNSFKIHYHAP